MVIYYVPPLNLCLFCCKSISVVMALMSSEKFWYCKYKRERKRGSVQSKFAQTLMYHPMPFNKLDLWEFFMVSYSSYIGS